MYNIITVVNVYLGITFSRKQEQNLIPFRQGCYFKRPCRLKFSEMENDPEMQRFIAEETQKAKFQSNTFTFTDICWDKCIDSKIPSKMDSRTEQCMTNCVERFLDTTHIVISRLQNNK